MNHRPKSISSLMALIATTALIAGCSNMSGLNASSNYSCPAPPGVVCKPMSEVYRSQNVRSADASNVQGAVAGSDAPNVATTMRTSAPAAGFLPGEMRPLRSQPKVLRIWVAPYEDTDGDLHEEHRMYLQVDAGRWMVEHHRARIQNSYTPLRAPSTAAKRAPIASPASNPAGVDIRAQANTPDAFDSAPDNSGVSK